jgi:UPF0716 protein FxsA
MPVLLVVLFVVVPLVELVVIIRVAKLISTGPTIALLVADSILGAWLLRREGRRAWAQFRTALEQMRWPGDEVTQGALVIVGGTLLLTQGFVTDVLGFLLLLPPTRAVLSRVLRARLTPVPIQGVQQVRRRRQRRRGEDGSVLDVEVVEVRRDEGRSADDGRMPDDGRTPDEVGDGGHDDGPSDGHDDGRGSDHGGPTARP